MHACPFLRLLPKPVLRWYRLVVRQRLTSHCHTIASATCQAGLADTPESSQPKTEITLCCLLYLDFALTPGLLSFEFYQPQLLVQAKFRALSGVGHN